MIAKYYGYTFLNAYTHTCLLKYTYIVILFFERDHIINIVLKFAFCTRTYPLHLSITHRDTLYFLKDLCSHVKHFSINKHLDYFQLFPITHYATTEVFKYVKYAIPTLM